MPPRADCSRPLLGVNNMTSKWFVADWSWSSTFAFELVSIVKCSPAACLILIFGTSMFRPLEQKCVHWQCRHGRGLLGLYAIEIAHVWLADKVAKSWSAWWALYLLLHGWWSSKHFTAVTVNSLVRVNGITVCRCIAKTCHAILLATGSVSEFSKGTYQHWLGSP